MSVKGSFSIHFTYAPNDSLSVLLETDITGIAAYLPDVTANYKPLSVNIGTATYSGDRYLEVSTLLDGVVVNKSDGLIGPTALSELNIWIYIYNNAVTVYCNDRWYYTYVLSFSKYLAYVVVATLKAVGAGATLTNIRREEIPDWRDAVFVDYEATGDNALQSIYQQRPVWIFPQPGRVLAFTYHTTKDQVDAIKVKSYSDKQVNNQDISSDGLVYYYDVGVSCYEAAAKEVGLVTRLYRLSELDIGGVEATRTIQEIALEHRNPVDAEQRLDPRLEISDRSMYDMIVTGTEMHIVDDVIVEDISLSIENGKSSMRVTGRRNRDGSTLFQYS
jgi:hypothetical protein